MRESDDDAVLPGEVSLLRELLPSRIHTRLLSIAGEMMFKEGFELS